MNKKLLSKLLLCFTLLLLYWKADAQINLIKDYQNNYSKAIGTFQGINFREAGFSTLFPIAGGEASGALNYRTRRTHSTC